MQVYDEQKELSGRIAQRTDTHHCCCLSTANKAWGTEMSKNLYQNSWNIFLKRKKKNNKKNHTSVCLSLHEGL